MKTLKYALSFLFIHFSTFLLGGSHDLRDVNSQMVFTKNEGQVLVDNTSPTGDVLFTTYRDNLKIFFTSTGISYQFIRPNKLVETGTCNSSTYRVDVILDNANPNTHVIGLNKTGYTENFYLAHCENGITNVPSFTKIIYKDVYPNIDWLIYSDRDGIKYDFVLHPGSQLDQIRLMYKYAGKLNVSPEGDLTVSTDLGKIFDSKPVSFQNGNEIQTVFSVAGNYVSFECEEYDPDQLLVVDPGISWSTYYGGSDFDLAYSVTTDGLDNLYIAGFTSSTSGIASGGFQNM